MLLSRSVPIGSRLPACVFQMKPLTNTFLAENVFFFRMNDSDVPLRRQKGRNAIRGSPFDCEEKSDSWWQSRQNQNASILIKDFLTDHRLMANLLWSATKTPVCCRPGPLKAADLIVLKYLCLFISFVYRIFSMLTQPLRRRVNAASPSNSWANPCFIYI